LIASVAERNRLMNVESRFNLIDIPKLAPVPEKLNVARRPAAGQKVMSTMGRGARAPIPIVTEMAGDRF
jgi:hypothetical protein